VITRPAPPLDTRTARQLLDELLARRAAYVPAWDGVDRAPGTALAAIASRYAYAILQRLNRVPEKQKLAFLDLAGLSLVPAQAARAPIVFQLNEQAAGGAAGAGTSVAAPPPPGSTEQIVFETEEATGVMPGKLAQVVSLWPGRDSYIDHSADYLAKRPFQLFSRRLLEPTPHHLYLAHDTLLALAGNVELGVEFEITQPSGEELDVRWEYWDGQVWRGFRSTSAECADTTLVTPDSTRGLTSSGTYQLLADCAVSQKLEVAGSKKFWLRGRLTEPLPPDPENALPEVEAVRISATVNRGLTLALVLSPPYASARLSNTASIDFSAGLAGGLVLSGNVFNVLETGIGRERGGGREAFAINNAASNLGVSGVVRNEAGAPIAGAVVSVTDPNDPALGQITSQETTANGRYTLPGAPLGRKYVFKVAYAGLEGTAVPQVAPSVVRALVDIALRIDGLNPEKAFADTTKIDVTKPFYPVGQQPAPGTTFYFAHDEVFAKPGARVRLYVARTRSPQDEAATPVTSTQTNNDPVTLFEQAPVPQNPARRRLEHTLIWEYWNGRQWTAIAVESNLTGSELDLDATEVVDLTVPIDILPIKVNDDEARWIRVRIDSGSYGFAEEVTWLSPPNNTPNRFVHLVTAPPVLSQFRIGYTWQYGPFHPEQVLAYNDFRFEDRTSEAIWPGTSFLPFQRVADLTPALYLGFEKQAPVDRLGFFFDITEARGDVKGPALDWQYWDGFTWRDLSATDDTAALRLPGIVSIISAANNTALARFGKPLFWLRAALKEDGPPGEPEVRGIHPNAVMASQRRTLRDVAVGASRGTPDQIFTIPQIPILPGESLEVRELNGPRANVEWRIIANELFSDPRVIPALEEELRREGPQTDIVRGPLRLRRDRKKQVTEAWVHWDYQPFLQFSRADDRHYALDRALGRLFFGDGVNGKVPPQGAAILVRVMQSGGGARGNVAANTITQLLGVVPGVQAVFNPVRAEGGADGETADAIVTRGPATIRHRGRAVSAADYETLAREASPGVAYVRAIPNRNPAGRPLPGWLTLLIIPESEDARPYPSFGLRTHVRKFLESRAAADLAGRIHVTGPEYLPLDLDATIAPRLISEAGIVEKAVRAALQRFLHPLRGGPSGTGWELGRDVYLSDIAAVLERVEGLDYVSELTMLLDGVPQGDRIRVADDRIVVAGDLRLRVRAAEVEREETR
jgi:hypothetical protein